MAAVGMTARTFKSAWFVKAARKAHISDFELYEAIQEVEKGQADDLGGGVFKIRLNRNRHRAVILSRSGQYWIYQYLFAKKDRANIDADELKAFRLLAKSLGRVTDAEIAELVIVGELTEICDDRETGL